MHNRRPVIGVTASINEEQKRIFIHNGYMEMLEKAGAIPLIMPVTDDETLIDDMIDMVDGVLLSGGGDILSSWWGEEQHPLAAGMDPLRDRMETMIVRKLHRLDMPTLGICRGVQMMNVALGGTLVQDIPSQVDRPIIHRDTPKQYGVSHTVQIEQGTKLAEIVGCGQVGVNTLHHQAVREAAPCLRVTARAEDGVIEAVEDPGKRFFLGVQWHPERLGPGNEAAMRIFAYFCNECKNMPNGR